MFHRNRECAGMQGVQVLHGIYGKKVDEMRRNPIPGETWDLMVIQFELGTMSGSKIARELGVSPQTVMREMRKRGAIKGSRIHEATIALNAEIDRRQLERLRRDREVWDRNYAIAKSLTDAVGDMMYALVAADEMGDITLVDDFINQLGDVLPAKRAVALPSLHKAPKCKRS
jgi:hypothetical protein